MVIAVKKVERQEFLDRYRLVIDSLGHATPASAAAVAKGLGMPASEVIRCIYRAPSILVEDIDFALAENLSSMLKSIGFTVSIHSLKDCSPTTPKLFELAVYLKDISRFSEAANRLSSFLGAPIDEARKMLLTAPGSVLGGVSDATIQSFVDHMQGSVEVTVCEQDEGLFSIFASDMPSVVRARLMQDIRTQKIDPIGEQGLIATDVPHEIAQKIWERHKSNTALRIINQSFLRYDILIEPLDALGSVLPDQQRKCLLENTDIPEDMIDEVVAAAPISVVESVTHANMRLLMDVFAKVDLKVRADLITFQHLQLLVSKAESQKRLNEQLVSWGGSPITGALPQTTIEAYPEIQARMLQHVLQQQGAEVELACK